MTDPSAAMLERAKVLCAGEDAEGTLPCSRCKRIALAMQAVAEECAEIAEKGRKSTLGPCAQSSAVMGRLEARRSAFKEVRTAIRAHFGLQGER